MFIQIIVPIATKAMLFKISKLFFYNYIFKSEKYPPKLQGFIWREKIKRSRTKQQTKRVATSWCFKEGFKETLCSNAHPPLSLTTTQPFLNQPSLKLSHWLFCNLFFSFSAQLYCVYLFVRGFVLTYFSLSAVFQICLS